MKKSTKSETQKRKEKAAYAKEYRRMNKETIAAQKREYYLANRPIIIARSTEWIANNRPRHNDNNKRSRVKRKGDPQWDWNQHTANTDTNGRQKIPISFKVGCRVNAENAEEIDMCGKDHTHECSNLIANATIPSPTRTRIGPTRGNVDAKRVAISEQPNITLRNFIKWLPNDVHRGHSGWKECLDGWR